jgi:Holliday junction DNA helicase RuvA
VRGCGTTAPSGHARDIVIGWIEGEWRRGVVVTRTGVGYLVHTPVAGVDGETVELWVTTVVREDSITLWGFPTEAENLVFQALLKVQGVGVTAAMNLLKEAGCERIVTAVAVKDASRLRVKGVGQKTAERIVADIALPDVDVDVEEVARGPHDEISDVLIGLGFDERLSRSTAERVIAELPGSSEQEWLARALAIAREAA